jgi:hypothetical protein
MEGYAKSKTQIINSILLQNKVIVSHYPNHLGPSRFFPSLSHFHRQSHPPTHSTLPKSLITVVHRFFSAVLTLMHYRQSLSLPFCRSFAVPRVTLKERPYVNTVSFSHFVDFGFFEFYFEGNRVGLRYFSLSLSLLPPPPIWRLPLPLTLFVSE